jgi:hypothetical protein
MPIPSWSAWAIFAGLPDWHPQIVRRAGELKAELGRLARGDPAVRQAIDAAVSQLNGNPAMLDALVRDQHWRAAHFRVAGDDINYRRFFDINDLAGLRMELPELFDHTHVLVLRLLEQGTLDGLRIDHIDGLLDPKAYLERCAPATPVLSCRRENPRAPRVVARGLAGRGNDRIRFRQFGAGVPRRPRSGRRSDSRLR